MHASVTVKTFEMLDLMQLTLNFLPIRQLFCRCSSWRFGSEYTKGGTLSRPFPERFSTWIPCITCMSAGNWFNLFPLKSSSNDDKNKTQFSHYNIIHGHAYNKVSDFFPIVFIRNNYFCKNCPAMTR